MAEWVIASVLKLTLTKTVATHTKLVLSIQATITLCAIVASVWVPTGRWKPRLLCGSHTVRLQAESVLAWLAACWWAWAVCLRLSQGARKQQGTDRRFQLLVYDSYLCQGGYVFLIVCLSICLFVSNFMQKLPNGFAW